VNARLSFDFGGFRTEVVFGRNAMGGDMSPESTVTVFDANTAALFGAEAVHPVVLPAGEASKCWASVESIIARCASTGMGRDGVVAGVGGGVVCDVAALAASLYMRGCILILVPTTLLAMVDASLGGKTAIDFRGFKNLVGTFYPASRIEIAVERLKSLPGREYLSGLAEAIKTAIVGDAELLSLLRDRREDVLGREPAVVAEIVGRCVAVKGRIAAEDPRESGRRALLNLGHTFGHALESATGFSGWTHGEAVAWGLGRALAAGLRLGITDAGFARSLEDLLRGYGFRLEAGVEYADLAPALERDKKRRGGRVRLVIPRGPADLVVREVPEGDLAAVIDVAAHPAERKRPSG